MSLHRNPIYTAFRRAGDAVLLRAPRVVRAWRERARSLGARREPGGLVLLYHSIADPATDPWSVSVSAQHFAEHLDVLSRRGTPARLRDMSTATARAESTSGTFAITFDDGYANNLHAALPLLERHGIPATIFVTSGYVGADRAFWWDELEHLVFDSSTLPERLTLAIADTTYDLTTATSRHGCAGTRSGVHRRTVAATGTSLDRNAVFQALYWALRPLSDTTRWDALDTLHAWAGATAGPHPDRRPLLADEIAPLAASDLIDIGAHTRTHPHLPTLSASEQWEEISGSRAQLQQLLDRPVDLFAYPFGGRGDVPADSVAIARDAGFRAACMNVPGALRADADVFRLPRMYVSDWDGDTFEKHLVAWQSA